jgi:hypothetical protein
MISMGKPEVVVELHYEMTALILWIKNVFFKTGYAPTLEEVLGMLVNQYFEQNGPRILETCLRALEDTNFNHKLEETVPIMAELEELLSRIKKIQ